MPLPIADRRLSQLYKTLEDNNGKIDDAQALKMLAEVGDRAGLSAASALSQLRRMTPEQQVALIKRGMSASEKADLGKILDQTTVKLDPTAKTFFEKVLGRQTPPPPVGNGDLKIVGDQSNGLSGFAKPGDKIEAINISAAPTGRLRLDDTTVIATAGADGKFTGAKLTGEQGIKEGDLIRMRARHADGTVGEWVTVRATGIASSDTRNAEVAIFRIGLADGGDGKIDVTNINASRQVSEPGAKLQFTNARTGEKTVVTLNDKGTFADGVKLNGKAGDTFSVASTDGRNNTAFTATVGKLQVPGADGGTVDIIKDPALHKDELDASGKPRFSSERFTGPLFKNGVSLQDPVQGQIGDCYFPAAVAAIAKDNPNVIEDMIQDNGDGTYTVTFKERDWRSASGFRDVKVKVDGDLYVRSWGGPLYGSSGGGDKGAKTMELWFPIVEKAYAQWKGSFDAIGNGGHASTVMQEFMGKDGQDMNINESNGDRVFAQIKRSLDAKQPVAAGTYGDTEAARYTNTGVYADHAYSVIGYEERNGEKFVKLRNPWGESEPAGNGANDGIFELDIKTFSKLYQNLMYTNP